MQRNAFDRKNSGKLGLDVKFSETVDIQSTSYVHFPLNEKPILKKRTQKKITLRFGVFQLTYIPQKQIFQPPVALYNVFMQETRVI